MKSYNNYKSVFLTACISLSLFSSEIYAVTRNCTPEERASANEVLLKIAADENKKSNITKLHLPLGLHVDKLHDVNNKILYQNGYILSHDKILRTSLWVSYKLTSNDVLNSAGKGRVNCFRRDPRLKFINSATPADYREPLYDQGHMANDADLKDDLLQQINTYVMSNMSPQHCKFNRGVWLSLEHLTRKWAKQYKKIYVTSGAIFDRDKDGEQDVGSNILRMVSKSNKKRVAVPSHYYKVIIKEENGTWDAITFLLENNNNTTGVKWESVRPHIYYSISNINVIEKLTGITLHPNMDRDTLSERLNNWDLSVNKNNFESSCN